MVGQRRALNSRSAAPWRRSPAELVVGDYAARYGEAYALPASFVDLFRENTAGTLLVSAV